jgi:hypothetical protein
MSSFSGVVLVPGAAKPHIAKCISPNECIFFVSQNGKLTTCLHEAASRTDKIDQPYADSRRGRRLSVSQTKLGPVRSVPLSLAKILPRRGSEARSRQDRGGIDVDGALDSEHKIFQRAGFRTQDRRRDETIALKDVQQRTRPAAFTRPSVREWIAVFATGSAFYDRAGYFHCESCVACGGEGLAAIPRRASVRWSTVTMVFASLGAGALGDRYGAKRLF